MPASALKDLIDLAKRRPEKVWGTFQRWYGRPEDHPGRTCTYMNNPGNDK